MKNEIETIEYEEKHPLELTIHDLILPVMVDDDTVWYQSFQHDEYGHKAEFEIEDTGDMIVTGIRMVRNHPYKDMSVIIWADHILTADRSGRCDHRTPYSGIFSTDSVLKVVKWS